MEAPSGRVPLAVVVVVMLWRRFMGGRGAQQNTPAYAGAGAPYSQRDQQTPDNNVRPMNFQSADAQGGASAAASNIPPDFDVEAFVRQAKLGFIRLQAANDTADLADIRDFTTPEVFAEIKMSIDERKGATQKTDVILLEAEVLEVAEEDQRYIVSVHFSGQLREEANTAPAAFAEIWHLVKPVDGNRGWMVAGIQQLQ